MSIVGRVVFAVGLAMALPLSAASEDGSTTAAQERMAPLQELVGEWEGESWRAERDGRLEMSSREIVQSRLDGLVILVEGIHESKARPGEVVHHAFGMLTWDEDAQTYRFRTQLTDGRGGDFEAELLPDGRWRWGMERPGYGSIRYTISFQNDRWEEIGERSRDGQSWQQFFEMTLDRVR